MPRATPQWNMLDLRAHCEQLHRKPAVVRTPRDAGCGLDRVFNRRLIANACLPHPPHVEKDGDIGGQVLAKLLHHRDTASRRRSPMDRVGSIAVVILAHGGELFALTRSAISL